MGITIYLFKYLNLVWKMNGHIITETGNLLEASKCGYFITVKLMRILDKESIICLTIDMLGAPNLFLQVEEEQPWTPN